MLFMVDPNKFAANFMCDNMEMHGNSGDTNVIEQYAGAALCFTHRQNKKNTNRFHSMKGEIMIF